MAAGNGLLEVAQMLRRIFGFLIPKRNYKNLIKKVLICVVGYLNGEPLSIRDQLLTTKWREKNVWRLTRLL